MGVAMTEDEPAAYNAEADRLNAELAAGRDPFGPLGSAENAGETATSSVQRPWCPRGDSNTRHAV
jgi:hypothetical protein